MADPKVWVCQVRREAFVGGESQRCRHASTENVSSAEVRLFLSEADDLNTKRDLHSWRRAASQYLERFAASGDSPGQCGEMELIGGEPVEWCSVHEAEKSPNDADQHCWPAQLLIALSGKPDPCQFESQIRVGP